MTTSETSNPTPPRRGRGALVLLAAALVGAGLGGGAVLLAGRAGGDHDGHDHATAEAPERWTCPMHPTVVQDHPGDCPICGMKLVKVAEAAPAAAAKGGAAKGGAGAPDAKARYLCPMHPDVVSENPDDRCPLCGMKLVKAPEATGDAGATQWSCPMHPTIVQDHPGDCPICGMKLVKGAAGGAGGVETPVEGLASVTIEPARQQLIGLRTTKVSEGEVGGSWRAAGRVAIDETRVHHVNVKVGGFVEHDHGGFIGRTVKKGEALFSLYSPELLAAQEEYLLALRTRQALAGAGAGGEGEALVAAARRKLELWDVTASDLARLEREGVPRKAMQIHAPATGVVTKREVVPGMRIEAGAMPYEIVDLSRVWVLADVYESELRHVKVGMPASLTLKAYPNRKFEGRVAFIDPMLDPKSRTVKVRLEFPNGGGELKPEMFGEVLLEGAKRWGLVLPADTVIDSGTMKVVFVALGEGRFQPREVKLGDGDGRHVEVLEGLMAGEEVATGANFLVDSESRLRASLAAMASGGSRAKTPAKAAAGDGAAAKDAPPADPHAGHGGR